MCGSAGSTPARRSSAVPASIVVERSGWRSTERCPTVPVLPFRLARMRTRRPPWPERGRRIPRKCRNIRSSASMVTFVSSSPFHQPAGVLRPQEVVSRFGQGGSRPAPPPASAPSSPTTGRTFTRRAAPSVRSDWSVTTPSSHYEDCDIRQGAMGDGRQPHPFERRRGAASRLDLARAVAVPSSGRHAGLHQVGGPLLATSWLSSGKRLVDTRMVAISRVPAVGWRAQDQRSRQLIRFGPTPASRAATMGIDFLRCRRSLPAGLAGFRIRRSPQDAQTGRPRPAEKGQAQMAAVVSQGADGGAQAPRPVPLRWMTAQPRRAPVLAADMAVHSLTVTSRRFSKAMSSACPAIIAAGGIGQQAGGRSRRTRRRRALSSRTLMGEEICESVAGDDGRPYAEQPTTRWAGGGARCRCR